MRTFFVRRLLVSIVTLVGVSLISFFLLQLIPGDPARVLAGPDASEADVAALRSRLGLDQPMWRQYLGYLSRVSRGNLGSSLRSGKPVIHEITARLPVTVRLTVLSLGVAMFIAVPTGIYAAVRRSKVARVPLYAVILVSCMPVFWTGLVLVLFLSIRHSIFPPGGAGGIRYYVLPALALGASTAGLLARLIRTDLTEVWKADYIRTARSKGLKTSSVLFRHAMRNALIPVITVLGLQLGQLLGGAILTESLFALNGIGRYLVLSIAFRDYVAVQGVVLFIAVTFVSINLLVDLLYGIIDPRISYS